MLDKLIEKRRTKFKCHLSPTPTAIAKDPFPVNCPTMYSRLVCQDRVLSFGTSLFIKKKNLQSTRFRVPGEGKHRQTESHTDIANYRLNQPRADLVKNLNKFYQK